MMALAEEPVALESSEWRPYVYMEGSEPKGLAYERVKAVFERADVTYEFSIKPWARVYKNGLTKKNYFILGLGRTVEREALFKWIAPITKEVNIHLYKLKKSTIQINNIEEVKKYPIGVERGTYHQTFIDAKFPQIKQSLLVTSEQLLKMLIAKRVDFILLEETRLLSISEDLGVNPNLFEKSLLAFRVQEYLAASLNTDDVLVNKLKKSDAELTKENLITALGREKNLEN